MAATKKPFKIFKSLDLRFNKLLNAKVETPTAESNDKIITNVEYVKNSVTYDTEKVTAYSAPFTFSWMSDIKNKTFKQIFDDLFFPRVLPFYYSMSLNFEKSFFNFQNLTLSNNWKDSPASQTNSENIQLYKYNLFTNQSTQGTFKYIINDANSDRQLSGLPYLKIIDSDSNETVFEADIQNLDYFITFNYIFLNQDCQIKFGFKQSPATTTKTDSYGDNYVPTEYQSEYSYEVDVTELFNSKISYQVPFMISSLQESEGTPDINSENYKTLFTVNNKFTVQPNTEAIINILISSIISGSKPIKYIIYWNSTKYVISEGYLTIDMLQKYTSALEQITDDVVFGGGFSFTVCQFNFGIFQDAIDIELNF